MAGGGYRPDPVPSVYGWWNHWPVAPIPGDGRWVTTPDRPSHFNLTTFVQWNDYKYTERTRTRIMLQGVTDKNGEELVPLAKSWLNAPKMNLTTSGFTGDGYDQSERAYIIEKTDAGFSGPCQFVLEATKESPVLNSAIIIKNWGNQLARLSIDGKNVAQGKDFRQGIRKGVDGDDLILWIREEKQSSVQISLVPEN
jgi:hypothetical protein